MISLQRRYGVTSPAGIFLAIWLSIICKAAWADTPMDGLQDPTRPSKPYTTGKNTPHAASGRASRLALQSILIAHDRKTAIINGRVSAVGSRIKGARIVAIHHDSVVVRRNGRSVTLRLPSSNTVKNTRN